MKRNYCILAIAILFALLAAPAHSQSCAQLAQGATPNYVLGLKCTFTASSSPFGAFGTSGIQYWQVVFTPSGTVSAAALSFDSSVTGQSGSWTTGGIISAATIGSMTSAGHYGPNSSPTTPSNYGQLTPTITGSGSVTVILYGYTTNPVAGGGSCIATVATLSSSCGTVAGTVASVTDGSTSSDCTVGGGSNKNVCIYSGSAWAFAGSAGSAPTFAQVLTGTNTGQTHTVGSGGTLNVASGAVIDFSAIGIGTFKVPSAAGGVASATKMLMFDSTLGFLHGWNGADAIWPQTLAAVSHKFLNSYTIGTGAFTQAQPASTDLSDLPVPVSSGGTGVSTGAQNLFFATPNGSSGAPALRAIVAVDIPTLNQSTTGNAATASNLSGCIGAAAGDICYYTGSAWARLPGNTGGTNWLQETSGGTPSWSTPSGSGPGTGTVNYFAYWSGTGTLGSVGSTITGQVPVIQNGAAPIAASPGFSDAASSPVSSASVYTIQCDSSTTIIDRGHGIRFQSGANASPVIPLSSLSGCTNLMVSVMGDGAGALTFARTSPDTFTIFDGVTKTDGATSFSLSDGQFASVNQAAAGIWEVRLNSGNASKLNGTAFPASATVIGSDGSGHPIVAALNTGQMWNGVSNLPVGTATPTLGASGTLGSLTFGNATSGLLTLQPTTGAITSYTIGLPVAQPTSGNTFLSCTAASPAVCTWVAGGGGDTITSPNATLSVGGTSSATTLDVAGSAGKILAGATPALTATPTLGASGTLGSLTLGNATSGTVTLQPVTGALGVVTASLPANTGTVAETNLAQTFSANQTLTGHLIMSAHDVALPRVCADSSGSGTAQVCNTSPTFVPAAGDTIIYTTTTPNSGTGLTVNVNSLGAKSVAKWQTTTTLAANDVLANTEILLKYDGTNWEMDAIGNAPSGGAAAWSSLTNAASALTLANGTNATTFNQTSAANWTWANTTAATVSVPQNSPIFNLLGQGWVGAGVTGAEGWTVQDVIAAGLNPTNTWTFGHTGTSTGNMTFAFPGGTTLRVDSGWFIANPTTSGGAVLEVSGYNTFTGLRSSNAITDLFGDNGAGTSFTGVYQVTTPGQKTLLATLLKATAALTSGQVVKVDSANASSVVVATTADTGAGAVLGFVDNAPGAAAAAQIAMPGSILNDPVLGTGTCSIGNFVINDTTTNGRVKCTATFTAGTILGYAITAQATVGSAVSVYVMPR